MSLVPPAVRGLLALSRRSSHCSPARHCSLGRRSDARHPPPHSAGLFREGLRRPAPGPAGWLRWRSKADSCTKHSIWCNRQGDCTLRHQIKLFGAVVAFTALSFGGFGSVNVINLKRLLNGKQNVWKYQNGEEKSDSDGREKDV